MSPSKHSRAPDSATCAYVYARGATSDFQLASRANQIKLRSHLRDLLIEVFDLQSRLVPALQRGHHVTQVGQQSLLSPPSFRRWRGGGVRGGMGLACVELVAPVCELRGDRDLSAASTRRFRSFTKLFSFVVRQGSVQSLAHGFEEVFRFGAGSPMPNGLHPRPISFGAIPSTE